MYSQRHFFVIIFLVISFILWQFWDFESNQALNFGNKNTMAVESNSYLDQSPITNNYANYEKDGLIFVNNSSITVKTDVLLIRINVYGGDIEEAYLVKYLEDLKSMKPFHLLNKSAEFKYQAYSGFIDLQSPVDFNKNKQLLYFDICNKDNYVLQSDQNELQVILLHKTGNGIVYTKRYVFRRNSYSIDIYYTVNNTSTYPLQLQLFGNLEQSIHATKAHEENGNKDNFIFYSSDEGLACFTDKEKYKKYSFKDVKRTDLNISTYMGWIAMLQKYFVTAWLPIIPENNTFYTYSKDDSVVIGFKSNPIYIPVNEVGELRSTLWIGPKIQSAMKLVNSNLDFVINYGCLWFISQPLFRLLQFIHYYIDNWGVSIVLITLIIRLVMYPLTKAQYVSIAKIRMLQPKLISIQEECKYDKYLYHQRTIELYKSERVNPLGGCLPLLIQMPIFLALYYMLSGSVELRHAKFVLWINDLSSQDPYYILPVVMGITMFFAQKLSPTTISDAVQKKIMTIMLAIFTIFFLWFPSGLVLYYIISNVITIIQQQLIYHELSKKGLYC